MKKRTKIILTTVAVFFVILVAACGIYIGDYYHALPEAAAVAVSDDIAVTSCDNGDMVFSPTSPVAGLIFYPGGKVEHTAYVPLMVACAERDILCVLTEMPCRLAVLDINAAEGIAEQYPEVEAWYIGGHSLGGSMAASYLERHSADFVGLILLASYATSDLSDTELEVLSVYGSEDGVLDLGKYEESKGNLPAALTELVIDGGNHAGFGIYGPQDGDGAAMLSCEEQIALTADAIAEMIDHR